MSLKYEPSSEPLHIALVPAHRLVYHSNLKPAACVPFVCSSKLSPVNSTGPASCREREFFIDNLLVRIHYIIAPHPAQGAYRSGFRVQSSGFRV